jgi:protein-tyrosine phosphatase
MTDDKDRIVAFEGVRNFRDFGGYSAGEGRVVARGRLFRSAHLAHATPADHARMRAMGVAVVADLRRPSERAAEPNAWPSAGPNANADAAAARVIANDLGDESAPAPHLRVVRDVDALTPDAVRAYMTAVYETIASEERHVALFRDVFAALTTEESGLLVHCAAGKDRTGVLCGLILDTLGVSHADVVADYELTNRKENIEGVTAQAFPRIAARLGRPVSEDEVRLLASVSRDYLETAWAAMRARSGSLAGYRRDVLGVSEADEAALKARLVVTETAPR